MALAFLFYRVMYRTKNSGEFVCLCGPALNCGLNQLISCWNELPVSFSWERKKAQTRNMAQNCVVTSLRSHQLCFKASEVA